MVSPSRHCSLGFSIMMVSIILMGELSVAVLARPALPNTWSTSGTDMMILSCTCKIRLASALEISGRVTGIKRMLCSSRGGINSLPRLPSRGIEITRAMTLMANVVLRHFKTALMVGSYTFSSIRLMGLALSGRNFPFIKKEIRTGARVSTRSASTSMIKVLV